MEKDGGFGSGLLNDSSGLLTVSKTVKVRMREGTQKREQGVLRRLSNARRAMTPQCKETSHRRHLPCGRNPHLRKQVHKLNQSVPIGHLPSDLPLLPPPKCKCRAPRAPSQSSNKATRVNQHQKRLPYASKSSTEHHVYHIETIPTATTHAPQTGSSPSHRAARGNSSFQIFLISRTLAMEGTGTALVEEGSVADLSKEL
jgi:hypothetical protein